MDEARERLPSDLTNTERRGIKAIFQAARELIPSPAHWTRGIYARNNQGVPVSALSTNVVRYCISGALIRASFEHNDAMPENALDYGGRPEDAFLLPLGLKAFNYLGMFMAVATLDHEKIRPQKTGLWFIPPEYQDPDENDWIFSTWWNLPGSINDAPWMRHRSVLTLLDAAISSLDRPWRRATPAEETAGKDTDDAS